MLMNPFPLNRHNLKILGLISSDSGMFQCVGINNVGSVQASAFLEVIPIGNCSLFYSSFRFNLELIIVLFYFLFLFRSSPSLISPRMLFIIISYNFAVCIVFICVIMKRLEEAKTEKVSGQYCHHKPSQKTYKA